MADHLRNPRHYVQEKEPKCSRNEFGKVQITNVGSVVERFFPTMLTMFSNGSSRMDVH